MKYKPSKYNLIKKYDNEYLFYNLASNQVAVLDEHTYGVYKHCQENQNRENDERQILDTLFKVGFIVEAEKNETAFINSRRHSMIYYNTHEKCFVILPTTDCNARCYYCYQGNWNPIVMSEETANDVISFIKNSVPSDDRVHIAWFGGEPLYNYKIAKKINDAIKSQFGEKYHSTMTSNGSLINKSLAKELKDEWNLEGIQITIDNLYEKYDKVKNYIDNTKFQNIIDAITYCLDNDIQIIARINVDKTNIDDIEEIYSFLLDKFGENQKFKIDIELLKEECDTPCNRFMFEEKEYPQVLNKLIEIEFKYSSSPNINRFMCAQKNCSCIAQSILGVVVAPNGKLYKCQHIHNEDCIGDVKTGIIFNDVMKYFLDPNLEKTCEQCIYLPICQGGCLNFKKHGITVGSNCAKIKFNCETRLDIIYSIYNDKFKKEVTGK